MTSATPGPAADVKPLRRDAERNRQLILDAAADVFAERGLDAGFDEIARRAGVGVGTVYRRFPDREDLVEALFAQRMEAVAALAERACARSDAWAALEWFLGESMQMQAADRGLKQVLARSGRHDRLALARDRLTPAVGALLARAQASGALRRDVDVFDLGTVTTLLSAASTPDEPELWRRYLVLLLDGLRESRPAATPLPLDPPGEAAMAALAHDARRAGPVSTELPTLRHSRAEDLAALVTGSFLVAWGIVLLHSVGGLSGGVAGVAFLADYLGVLPVSVAFFLLNLPFYWLAVRRLGWEFSLKTFAAVALTSALSSALERAVTVEMPLLLATAFSGLSLGLGFIVLFRHRGSGGGFGVVAFYLQERLGWRAGLVQLVFDLTVLAASLAVVDLHVLAASAVGVAVLNLTIATNHRPGRYVAR